MQDSDQQFTHVNKGRLFSIDRTFLNPNDFYRIRTAITKFLLALKVRELINEFFLHTLLIAN